MPPWRKYRCSVGVSTRAITGNSRSSRRPCHGHSHFETRYLLSPNHSYGIGRGKAGSEPSEPNIRDIRSDPQAPGRRRHLDALVVHSPLAS